MSLKSVHLTKDWEGWRKYEIVPFYAWFSKLYPMGRTHCTARENLRSVRAVATGYSISHSICPWESSKKKKKKRLPGIVVPPLRKQAVAAVLEPSSPIIIRNVTVNAYLPFLHHQPKGYVCWVYELRVNLDQLFFFWRELKAV